MKISIWCARKCLAVLAIINFVLKSAHESFVVTMNGSGELEPSLLAYTMRIKISRASPYKDW